MRYPKFKRARFLINENTNPTQDYYDDEITSPASLSPVYVTSELYETTYLKDVGVNSEAGDYNKNVSKFKFTFYIPLSANDSYDNVYDHIISYLSDMYPQLSNITILNSVDDDAHFVVSFQDEARMSGYNANRTTTLFIDATEPVSQCVDA